MLDSEWEQAKRDVIKLERLHQQQSGRKKEILRRLKEFGINSLKEGVAAKKKGQKDELAAAEKWNAAMKKFGPHLERIRKLLEDVE